MSLEATLARGEAPVYLLHGEEPLLTREAMAWLRQAVLQGMLEDFNLDRFDGRDNLDPNRVVEAARTLPMMGAKRLVWVRNAGPVFDLGADKLKPLIEYVESPDPSTTLVFQASAKVKGTSALFKRVKKAGVVAEFTTPRERELPRWIMSRAKDAGRRLEPDAAALLVEALGRDLGALAGALERLMLFVEGGAPIELSHVEATVAHDRTRTVWELIDAIADRNVALALGRAHGLLGQGEPPLRLLGLVVRQFRQLLIGHAARAAGASMEDAARAAGMPTFRAQAFARQLRNYRVPELVAALERMAAADRALKGSKVSDAIVFEAMLLDLCA